MAGVGYTNTVPLGREGTGAAQVLGANRALQNYISTDAQKKERLLREQQLFQQRQQGFDDQFNKDLMSLNELAVAPAYQNDLNEITNALVQQGGQLKAAGINPYNPNQSGPGADAVRQWNMEVAKAQQAKVMANKFYDYKKSLMAQYAKPNSRFDYDEFMEVMNFEKNVPLSDLISGKAQLPEITERVDVGKELGKYNQIFAETRDYKRDASGNPIVNPDGSNTYVTTKAADIPRIQTVVQNEFVDGSTLAREVDRDLRKIYGKDASTRGLLRTTDEGEIREILDAEFRNNTTELNPVVELMSVGKIPSVNSPEYEDFLNTAVQEQLKAERVLDDAMQRAGNILAGKVNTREYQKFDYTNENQRMKRENQRLKTIKDNLTIDKLRTQKSRGWKSDGGSDYNLSDISDVTIKTNNNTDIVMAGATPGSTTEFEYNPTGKSYNIKTQEFDTNNRESAKLLGVGVVAVDKITGKVYPGDPRNYINNPNADFEVKAQVRASIKRGSRTVKEDFFEDPTVISKSLAGENKKFASKSLTNADVVLKDFRKAQNEALGRKETPTDVKKTDTKSTNKTKIDW